jgi:hypothetical protein
MESVYSAVRTGDLSEKLCALSSKLQTPEPPHQHLPPVPVPALHSAPSTHQPPQPTLTHCSSPCPTLCSLHSPTPTTNTYPLFQSLHYTLLPPLTKLHIALLAPLQHAQSKFKLRSMFVFVPNFADDCRTHMSHSRDSAGAVLLLNCVTANSVANWVFVTVCYSYVVSIFCLFCDPAPYWLSLVFYLLVQ